MKRIADQRSMPLVGERVPRSLMTPIVPGVVVSLIQSGAGGISCVGSMAELSAERRCSARCRTWVCARRDGIQPA